MLRLKYVVPRLIALFAFCLFLRFGLDVVLRFGVQSVATSAIGGQVDVGRINTQLARGNASLIRVQVANPRKPFHNLFEFEQASFNLEPRALLHRRLLVSDGVIHGLRLDTPRDDTGVVTAPPDDAEQESESGAGWERIQNRTSETCKLWLDDLAGRLQGDVADQFESVRLGRELSHRWPVEYEQLEQRLNDLKSRAGRLKQGIETVRQRPVEHLQKIPEYVEELNQIRNDVAEFRSELERLGGQILVDKKAIEIAKQNDLERIRELSKLDDLDGVALTEYLLGDLLVERVGTCRTWLRRLHAVASYVAGKPELNAQSGRGVDVSFELPAEPAILFRRLAVSGQTRVADRDVDFIGQIRNLTHQPHILGQPIEIDLATRGEVEARVKTTVTFGETGPGYQITAVIPKLAQPKSRLGGQGALSISLEPSVAALWMDVRIVNGEVVGEIRWRQDDVRMQAAVADRLGGARMTAALQSSVDEITRMHALVRLSGSLDKPDVDLYSNLGDQLSAGLRSAAKRQIEVLVDELVARAETRLADQFKNLDEALSARHGELLRQLSAHEEFVTTFQSQLNRSSNLNLGRLGNELRLDKLFSR